MMNTMPFQYQYGQQELPQAQMPQAQWPAAPLQVGLDAKKREALRLLESLDTQALLRLSAKLENRGLCTPAQASPSMPTQGSVQLNLAGATAADYARSFAPPGPPMMTPGYPPPPMVPGTAPLGMGSPIDFLQSMLASPPITAASAPEGYSFDSKRNLAGPPMGPEVHATPLPVGALPNNGLQPGVLPMMGALPAGPLQAGLQNSSAITSLESILSSGPVGQGKTGLGGAPFATGAPPPSMPTSPPKLPPSAPQSDGPSAPPGLWASRQAEQDHEAADYDGYDDDHHDEIEKPASNPSGEGDGNGTTLILRNLPSSFDQTKAQAWIDEYGYSGKYDFILWFPAKATSRLNGCGYAFVNFRTTADAQHCTKTLHMARFPDVDSSDSLPLSVAVAKVQGFAENYARFHHLLEANAPTRCSPFFAQDSIDALSQTERAMAETTALNPAPAAHPSNFGPVTTIVIRNLPGMIEDTEIARQWLDAEGCGKQYDFFLYLPAKRQRRAVPGKPMLAPQGYGYAFVNFKRPEDAEKCADKLNGKLFGDGTPALNIVTAKVQGKEECINHFTTLSDSGRCTPWVESNVLQAPTAPRTVFQ